MTTTTPYPSDIAFTDAVKAEQSRMGSRGAYAHMEEGRGWQTRITDDLREFLAERDSMYLATSNEVGQPYIQHRGGPRGFLRVIDDQTFGFADFAGNKQYITLGNLRGNAKARVERVMLIKVAAWDVNCPQHIPMKIDAADVAAAIETRDARIAELEAEVVALRAAGTRGA